MNMHPPEPGGMAMVAVMRMIVGVIMPSAVIIVAHLTSNSVRRADPKRWKSRKKSARRPLLASWAFSRLGSHPKRSWARLGACS
jgi:hypothetical protein